MHELPAEWCHSDVVYFALVTHNLHALWAITPSSEPPVSIFPTVLPIQVRPYIFTFIHTITYSFLPIDIHSRSLCLFSLVCSRSQLFTPVSTNAPAHTHIPTSSQYH
jgi:hypothetical protein